MYIKHQMLREISVNTPAASLAAHHAAEMTPVQRRQTMVDSQLRTVGITDADVLAAMATVAREDFLPPALHGLAYADAALEVAPGRWLLEPLVLGLLLQQAQVTRDDRVLVVGAATGYSTAVLGAIGCTVTALESDDGLIAAADNAGIVCVKAPLPDGWAPAAPYDLVLFEGAIEYVTPAIAAQLAKAGRAAAVVRDGNIGRGHAGAVLADGRIAGLAFLEVPGRLLPGFARPKDFAF